MPRIEESRSQVLDRYTVTLEVSRQTADGRLSAMLSKLDEMDFANLLARKAQEVIDSRVTLSGIIVSVKG